MKEKIKVLITDDSEMNLKLFEALVTSFGYDCSTAINGQIALDLIQKDIIDIVLLDIEMPILNGVETLKKIKKDFSANIPVIALTAHKNSEKLNQLIETGFSDYLVKPFSKTELQKMILKHIIKGDENVRATEITTHKVNQLFNLNYLYEMADNDIELMNQLIETFINLVPITIQNMRDFFKSENFDMLFMESHKFSSQLVFIGAKQTSDFAESIEKIAKEKINTKQISQLINNIETDCTIIINDLKSILLKS